MVTLWSLVLGGLTNNELLKLVKNRKTKVLELNDENFENILNGQRDYHLIALLTSEAPNLNCVYVVNWLLNILLLPILGFKIIQMV